MSLTLSMSLVILELLFLYISSSRLTRTLYQLFYLVTRMRVLAITILTILLFPGTILHELAHLFVAEILRVRTGKLTLIPDGLEEGEIRTGSVAITQTDPLRRTLIGLAPVYVGVVVLAALSYALSTLVPHGSNGSYGANGWYVINSETYLSLLIGYLLFAVSNSMFSSPEDMKGVVPFTITVGLFIGAAYMAGLRIGLTGQLLTKLSLVIDTLVRSLGVVIGVNIAVLLLTNVTLTILKRLTRGVRA